MPSPVAHFGAEYLEQLVSVLKSQAVLANAGMETDDEEENSQWKMASAQSLGLLLDKALDAPQDDQASIALITALQAGPVKTFLETEILTDLVSAVGSAGSGERYDQRVLALASTSSLSSDKA